MATEYGFVYVLANPAMPGLYKIGFTTRSPMARAAELSKWTGLPGDFHVEYYGEFESPALIEKSVHDAFSEQRVTLAREFFRENLGNIVYVIEEQVPLTSYMSQHARESFNKINDDLDEVAIEFQALMEGRS